MGGWGGGVVVVAAFILTVLVAGVVMLGWRRERTRARQARLGRLLLELDAAYQAAAVTIGSLMLPALRQVAFALAETSRLLDPVGGGHGGRDEGTVGL